MGLLACVANALRRLLPIVPLVFLTRCTIHRLALVPSPLCGVTDDASLWQCLEKLPLPSRPESGFRSTVRAAGVKRKADDQDPKSSCRGAAPDGFVEQLNISMSLSDRAPLNGFLACPSASRLPIVIVVHGMFDSRHAKYVVETGDFLRRSGFGVLLPDMRWHGCLLGGEWLPTLGIEEGRDLVEWAKWLQRECPDHPVGLIGFSLGATAVIHAMAQPEAEELFRAGAIAICPAAALRRTLEKLDAKKFVVDEGFGAVFTKAFRGYLSKRMKVLKIHHRDGTFAEFLRWLVHQPSIASRWRKEDRLVEEAEPVSALDRVRAPLLVMVTGNDPLISVVANEELRQAAIQNPSVHVIETAFGGHIGQIGYAPEWFASILETFFTFSPRVNHPAPN
jgi:predicted alpha/beta-fold hydrolase